MWQEVVSMVPEDERVSPLNFEKFFYRSRNYSSLRVKALSGKLHELHNRFLSWRVFLGILSESDSVGEWVTRVETMRKDYEDICQGLEQTTRVVADEHPLSFTASNPWNAQFEERQLRMIIKQDVDRTNQNLPLFKTPLVKDTLLSVLLTWARRNPSISYHQGMNEIAGILLYVAICEQPLFVVDIEEEAAQMIRTLNNPEWIEADVFWMFSAVMNLSIKELYRGRENTEDEEDPLAPGKTQSPPKRRAASVLKRINDIHHVYLKFVDEKLYTSLESSGTEPQLYLLRWVRCMLCREFRLHNTLILWDAILAHGEDLELLDFICVVMQVYVRDSLISADSGDVMRRLLRYPPVEDISQLLERAVKTANRYHEAHPKTLTSQLQARTLIQGQLRKVEDTLRSLLLERRFDEMKVLICIDTLQGLRDYIRELV